MEKIKSRWRKNYLEGDIINNDHNNIADSLDHHNNHHHHHIHNNINSSNNSNINNNSNNHHRHHHHHNNISSSSSKHSTPPTYEPLLENLYLDKRPKSRKDARSMVCDCILTKEERVRGIMGCLDDCLNRMLMIECGPKCTLGDHCLNKRFQKLQSAKVEVFKTRKKGWGLRTTTDLPVNSFIMEYVGEVIRSKEFRSRVKSYTKQKIKHHYFMALRSDEIIDATVKGNQTRFINHSCEPNCETQKWTVNGDLRIGFFTIRNLQAGEEITFDYQFQRYGRKAQKCYCEAPSCRSYIGGNDQTFSLNGNSSPQLNAENKAHKRSYKHGLLLDVTLEDKINALAEGSASGLKTKDQVIALASLSIKAEEVGDRRKLLNIIKTTKSEISLRLFVDYHGLEIICLWMRDPQADCDFKATIIEVLERLPIPNKTKVLESNVYRMIERWATEEKPKSVLPPPPSSPKAKSQDDDTAITETTTTTTTTTTTSNVSASSTDEKQPAGEEKDELSKCAETNNTNAPDGSESQQSIPRTPIKKTLRSNAQQPVRNNSPNIQALAVKLLKKFQALSPGFKIPRLNRLQRMEIEKKMGEEVISDEAASHDKLGFDQKNPFTSRNYFKSTRTNGLTNPTTTPKTNTLTNKRRYDSLTTNNIDLTPAPKISKEEHRQQFEMHVRLKDYYDTIKKHYGPETVEQLKLSQRAYTSTNGLPIPYPFVTPNQNPAYLGANHPITPSIPPPLLVTQPPPQTPSAVVPPPIIPDAPATDPSHLIYSNVKFKSGDSRRYQQPIVTPPNVAPQNVANTTGSFHLSCNGQQDVTTLAYQMNGRDYNVETAAFHDLYSHHKEPEPDSIATTSTINDTKMEPIKPEPTNLPTLIVLANNSVEPAYTINDELAFSICDYDEYYSIRDKPINIDDVIDDLYPYPGSYYTTPNGETWFATVSLDRKTKQPRTVILNLN